MNVVLDASALLALLLEERGADAVAAASDGGAISAVNLTEVIEKLADAKSDPAILSVALAYLRIQIVSFADRHAQLAAQLKPLAVGKQISFADRACLALVQDLRWSVLTGDRVWAELDLGIDIRLIR